MSDCVPVDIVVISALKSELDYLLDREDFNWSKFEDDPISSLQYKIGTLPETDITIAAAYARGMGLTDSAILTTQAITAFKPELLGMIGICAGREDKGVNIGDLIIPDKAYHYRFGSFKNGKIEKEQKVEQINQKYSQYMRSFFTEEIMGEIHTNKKIKGTLKPDRNPKVWNEQDMAMGSSDFVVKDVTLVEEAAEWERKLVGIEMESYAVLRTANLLNTKAIIIKAVIDLADPHKNDSYFYYTTYLATEAFIRFLTDTVQQGYLKKK
ncbi:hypothetical protein [Crocosphaera sp. XPORK-15E]|uniref:5'-methylthioadenosine/S-adenosylhomocysteine nucleosidase family protein n=1 Tax=Crocosphaera sp. XPORK-15E TaxID=3110247 RepID=UPI002B21F4C7|nr:hypothetical protein [Crocosphaera sp. XPORK-15E]MEA5535988.1 hypothetical protein [Crocosphaera sp. XPORK-15E]